MQLSSFLRKILHPRINVTVEHRAPRTRRRPRPDGGLSQMAEPPRGPLPLAGGAAAPLDFD